MIKKGLLAIALLMAGYAQAQEVAPYTPGTLGEGVVYYLPKTQIEVQVTASKVSYTPGELCQYANRYLRMQNISAQPEEHWEIKSIHVNTIGVPDTAKVYAVKVKEKSVIPQMQLTDNGIIWAINTKAPEEAKAAPEKPAEKAKRVDPRNFMTEEMLMAGSTNKMAELIAKEIYNIRESKNSLTRGQADYMPQDGAALKIMLQNLEEQEKALTEMFSGYTEHSEKTFTFYVDPKEEITNQVVCRFSTKLGIVNEKNLAGEPVYLSLTNENKLPAPASEEAKAKKKPEGIIYNIPGKGKVTVKTANKNYYTGKFSITQFGETEVLLFNKKINTRVIFNPVTGGILKIDNE